MWAGYSSAGNCLSETYRVQGLILSTAWIRYGSTYLYLFTVGLQGEGFTRLGDQDKGKTQSLSVVVHLGDFWLEREQCVKGGAEFPGCSGPQFNCRSQVSYWSHGQGKSVPKVSCDWQGNSKKGVKWSPRSTLGNRCYWKEGWGW